MNILLIVDPQIDFISGTLAVPGAMKAMDNLVEYIKNNQLDKVYITMDSHPKNHCSFKNYGGEWPEHCVKYTPGWLIYQPIVDSLKHLDTFYKGEKENKDEYSIFEHGNFYGQMLRNWLTAEKDDLNLYIAGIAGDYCVLNTLKDLIKLEFKENIIILKDCIASIDGGETLNKFIEKESLK